MYNAIPKARGPDINLSEVARNMIAQESRALVGGFAHTYRPPSPIPVQPHTSVAASSQKAKKTHHKQQNSDSDRVTAEDRELIKVSPEQWRFFLKDTGPLKTVAEYKAIWDKILKIRMEEAYQAQQKVYAEQRGESQVPSKTIKQLQKEYEEKTQAQHLEEVLARAGTPRSKQPINRLGHYK